MTADERYMKEAIRQARKAYALREVPIGCVIVCGDKIIARGYNRRNTEPRGLCDQARIDRVVIGTMNPKAGCAGSVLNLLEMEGFNHKVQVTRGILEEECSKMLSDFFKELREEKARKKLKEKEEQE